MEGEPGAWLYTPLIVECDTELDLILQAVADCGIVISSEVT